MNVNEMMDPSLKNVWKQHLFYVHVVCTTSTTENPKIFFLSAPNAWSSHSRRARVFGRNRWNIAIRLNIAQGHNKHPVSFAKSSCQVAVERQYMFN